MDLQDKIDTFTQLGKRLKMMADAQNTDSQYVRIIENNTNEWYSAENVKFALENISKNLEKSKIEKWLNQYPSLVHLQHIKKIGLVTAGNIPLVGFHDVLCVLLSGHQLVIKHSSKDEKLMNLVLQLLIEINPKFENYIRIEKDHLKNFDAVIATGSDNSAKFFEYYFGKYPHIIRRNRNSVAFLDGFETDDELELLADDIFMYFGLGCRNVSKIHLPENFDIQRLFKAVYKYGKLSNHNKYMNNFMYNKSIYLMNKVPFLENGFMILKEDEGISSPISVVYFERYDKIEQAIDKIEAYSDKIQCVACKSGIIKGSVDFGKAQSPELWDYADNVDTLEFLLTLTEKK